MGGVALAAALLVAATLSGLPRGGVVLRGGSRLVALAGPRQPTMVAGWAELRARLADASDRARARGITLGISIVDLTVPGDGPVVEVGGADRVPAASVIKLAVLASLMEAVDQGRLSLDTPVTVARADAVGGSGVLSAGALPKRIPVGELARLMVTVSDNTAANVLIREVGGNVVVNGSTERRGLSATHLGRLMMAPAVPPDRENYSSANDLSRLLAQVYRHEFLSSASSQQIIAWLRGQTVDTKFGAVVPRAVLADKTGENTGVSHDAGYFLVPGHEVAIAVTTRGAAEKEEDEAVRGVARTVYQFLPTVPSGGLRPTQTATAVAVSSSQAATAAGSRTRAPRPTPAMDDAVPSAPRTGQAALVIFAALAVVVAGATAFVTHRRRRQRHRPRH